MRPLGETRDRVERVVAPLAQVGVEHHRPEAVPHHARHPAQADAGAAGGVEAQAVHAGSGAGPRRVRGRHRDQLVAVRTPHHRTKHQPPPGRRRRRRRARRGGEHDPAGPDHGPAGLLLVALRRPAGGVHHGRGGDPGQHHHDRGENGETGANAHRAT
nr:hypothetical protein [Candidatus Frankia alpina]